MIHPRVNDVEIKLILEAIFLKYGIDFRGYSFASVRRRVELALTRFDVDSLGTLQTRLLSDEKFFNSLLDVMTVPTTEMFRDASYFKRIRADIVPVLRTYPSFKIWIAGCSTGEEAYSMAILLREEGLLERAVIYATDIGPQRLERAQTGIFPLDQIALYTSNYQKAGGASAFSDYYQAAYGSAIFDKTLKSQIVFTDHNLAGDHVFAEVEFISCRNVMIYFQRALQERVLGLFNESLSNRGFLGLGSKETLRLSPLSSKYDTVSETEKIYRKKGLNS